MKVIEAIHISSSGDMHNEPIAVFSTEEKAQNFLDKLLAAYPNECFEISDHYQLPIDPVDLDVIYGKSRSMEACHTSRLRTRD